jgi:hypothetical protein
MLNMLIVLLIVGALLYVISLAPIDATIKQIAKVIIIVFAIIWALRLLAGSGVLPF